MFDVRTYRVANEEERDIVFKAKEDLEFTEMHVEKVMPGGDAYYAEFYWGDEAAVLHFSADNGSIFEDIMKDGERQVTWVQFKAPHAKAACELFESLYKN